MTAMVTIDSNAITVAAEIGRAANIPRGVKIVSLTRKYTSLLRTEIIRNAHTGDHSPGAPHIPGTGPGPNVATGDYGRSWGPGRLVLEGTTITGELSSNAPQGPRLEYGFVGVDALGRVYDQPPYPHVQPALDVVGPKYEQAVTVLVTGELPK